MTFSSLQKVTASLQGWRFTTTGHPVTPQLTNPLGAKCFYNKVPVLKMRLTSYKSHRTEQSAYANWAKTPSQRAPVCSYPHSKDWFFSNGTSRLPLLGTLPHLHPSGDLLPLHPTSNSGTQYPFHTNNHDEFTQTHSSPDYVFLGIHLLKKYLFRVTFSQCVYFNQQLGWWWVLKSLSLIQESQESYIRHTWLYFRKWECIWNYSWVISLIWEGVDRGSKVPSFIGKWFPSLREKEEGGPSLCFWKLISHSNRE